MSITAPDMASPAQGRVAAAVSARWAALRAPGAKPRRPDRLLEPHFRRHAETARGQGAPPAVPVTAPVAVPPVPLPADRRLAFQPAVGRRRRQGRTRAPSD